MLGSFSYQFRYNLLSSKYLSLIFQHKNSKPLTRIHVNACIRRFRWYIYVRKVFLVILDVFYPRSASLFQYNNLQLQPLNSLRYICMNVLGGKRTHLSSLFTSLQVVSFYIPSIFQLSCNI